MTLVTFYTTLPLVGGSSTLVLGLARFFTEQGYAVRVLVRPEVGYGVNETVAQKLRDMGCQVTVLGQLRRDLWPALRAMRAANREAGRSLFISLGMGFMAPLLAWAGSFTRTAFYYVNHEPTVTPVRRLGWLRRAFDTIIAVSPASLEPLRRLVGPRQQVLWLPQFSELPAAPAGAREAGAATRFGFVGSLLPVKGILGLLDAWPAMPAGAELHILGDGELREEVARRSAALSAVRYRGGFAASERLAVLPAFFAEIDYLLVPSQGHGEGIPTVILEALCCGVPVISTNGGGTIAFGQPPLAADFAGTVTLVPQADFMAAPAAAALPTVALRQRAQAGYHKWFSDEVLATKWRRFADTAK